MTNSKNQPAYTEDSKTQVVAAIIKKDSKFLFGKRSLSKKSAPGLWSPISGKIEAGETQEEAIVRECQEEIGLYVQARKKITEFDIDNGKARLHWWIVDIVSGNEFLKNDEHTELRWFSVEEIKNERQIFSQDIAVFLNLSNLK